MLDNDTKKRIDDCRDILVGKLPDPKAQIEQITIGLIYKFMDDMDKESIELGGKAKFFTDYKVPNPDFPEDQSKDELVEFKKYSWDKLLNPKVSAADMLRLYSEAIEKMEKNPNIPQLFRDIFNNAYLPYRDPETLKLFLKIINGFEYTHSEKLGDAFEYLLSVMGSQGDAGQFRTPRHIIDFLVEIVDPGKKDSILDPACGTAGFLISAFKHIRNKNKGGFNPEEQKRLIKNFVGYDISPDMVRLSLVNLYLHGFTDPHIHEYDTLSSEDRWNESYDVILANPPFMSPKGGIRPHKKFSISSNRSEVLFVDYIAEHLNPDGKAGVIVPEGIIFQSGKAYKDLRKTLVEGSLYAVVSLPAGVFNPYSGVKTSILLMDKAVAKKIDKVLFVKIDNDGYNLGAQRTAIKGSQLEEAISLIHEFAASGKISDSLIAHTVLKTEVAANGDFNLSGERYRLTEVRKSNYPIVSLGDFIKVDNGRVLTEFQENGKIACIKVSDMNLPENSLEIITTSHWIKETPYPLLPVNSIVFPKRGAAIATNKKRFTKIPCLIDNNCMGISVLDEEKLNPKYLFAFMSEFDLRSISKSAGIALINNPDIKGVQIPLPPLSVQEEIVAEIEGYQKIIDGAKAVAANYKPKIDIDPDWEMVELGKHCKIKGGNAFKSTDYVDDGVQLIRMGNVKQMFFDWENSPSYLPFRYLDEYPNYVLKKGDLLISMTGTVGKEDYGNVCQIDLEQDFLLNQRVGKFEIQSEELDKQFLYFVAQTEHFRKQLFANSSGGVRQSNISNKGIESISIPFPPIETQRQIVAQIEKEQALVNANKQLIEIFEQKIKYRIAKVWGEEKQAEPEVTMAAEPEVEYKQ